MPLKRKSVFISYAHKDRKWADELVTYLAPWIRDERLELWDDSRLKPGEQWMEAIKAALEDATVAVPLVTKNFMASDFIAKHELPALLKRASERRLRLAWVAVGHSAVDQSDLWRFQAVNDPSRPLNSLTGSEREKAMTDIAKSIADAVTMGTFATGLHIIDETTEPLEAALAGRPERNNRRFGVQANYQPLSDTISFTGTTQTITAIDLAKLPDDDCEFLANLEDSMTRNYKRWKAIRAGLGDAGGALDGEVESQLKRIGKLMCRDLNSILDFLRKMYKAELEDHYGRYRYICAQLQST